jgi:cytochrome c biogenesis protein CcmG, thiol:disulfide interchange protein DsbE
VNRSRTPLVLAIVLVVAGVVALVAVLVTRGDSDDGDSASSVPTPAPGATPPGSAGGPPAGGTIDPLAATVTVDGEPLPPLEDPNDDPAVGMAAPALHGTNYAGQATDIVPGTGGPMLVVFLAHWCPHCNEEIPVLLEWRDSGGIPSDLQIFGVSTAVSPERPNYPPGQWLQDKGWDWPVLADDVDFTAGIAYGVTGFPGFTLIDADGNVTARGSGEISIDDLQALVNEVA